MRFLYTFFLISILPAILLRLLARSLREPEYRSRMDERLGRFPGKIQGGGAWIHAVSVGEVQAAEPLVKALILRYPDMPIISCELEELEDILNELIFDRERMKQIAKEGVAYYKKVHSLKVGGEYYKKIMNLK